MPKSPTCSVVRSDCAEETCSTLPVPTSSNPATLATSYDQLSGQKRKFEPESVCTGGEKCIFSFFQSPCSLKCSLLPSMFEAAGLEEMVEKIWRTYSMMSVCSLKEDGENESRLFFSSMYDPLKIAKDALSQSFRAEQSLLNKKFLEKEGDPDDAYRAFSAAELELCKEYNKKEQAFLLQGINQCIKMMEAKMELITQQIKAASSSIVVVSTSVNDGMRELSDWVIRQQCVLNNVRFRVEFEKEQLRGMEAEEEVCSCFSYNCRVCPASAVCPHICDCHCVDE